VSLRRFALFAAILVSGAAASAGAQESDIIRGKVTGPDSLPLENVKVTAMSLSTNQSISKNTGRDGRFTIIFPNGGGDFMISYTAIGFQPTQKEVKREQDEAILIADQALGKNPTMLNAIRVTAQRQQVDRNDDSRNSGVGSGDRGIDLSQVGIGSQGDLAAMAASLPGVTYIPGADGGPAGFSILGLGADQNLTTLNGLNFAGSDLPRDAVTTGRVSTNPFNPTQGGFSGGQLALRTSPGTNFVTQSVHFTMDSKSLQFTDPAGQQLGQQYNNLTASGAWRGPLILDKAYYSTSLQGSRQMSDLQTLINTDAYALQSIGISSDSVRRLDSLLNAFGIPSSLGTIPTSKVNDAFSGIAQIDWTPSAGHNFTFTANGSFRRAQAAGISSVRQLATNGGQTQSYNTALQARHSSYFGNGFLDETNSALQLANNTADPYLSLPDANIRVASTFDSIPGAVQTLVVGGNPTYPTNSKTVTWQTTNSTSWISMDNKHRWMLTEDVRVNQTQTDNSRNRLGTYTYNSIADFAAGQPASFTRLLSPRVRKGNDLGLAFSLSDTYRPTAHLQIQVGPRIDVLQFKVQPLLDSAFEKQLGIPNNNVPSGVFISPRIGFSYGYGTNAQIAGFQGAQRGTKYQISGGFGKFQNIPNSSLVSSAVDNTGLPSALQQLTCVGTAVPTVDWQDYLNNPNDIPTDCANGASVFANTSPNVSLFAKGYTPQASYRSALSWGGPIMANAYRVGVTGTLSFNQNQQGTIDLNFNNDPTRGFTLANEGNRPVYVAPSSIVTTTGAIGSSASRKVADFSRVTSFVSDLQSISKQISLSLSPILFNVNYAWSVNYTLQSVRDQQRGFTANTAADPNLREWGRASSDSRHQIQGNFRYTFHNAVTVSATGRLSSGTPYTPIISGDINGDGLSNDRAFIFDPSTIADPAFKTALENLLATSPAKDCLTSQMGVVAGRNTCQAPWFFNLSAMSVSFVSTATHLPQRATFRIGVTNFLTGVDLLMHGGNNMHGWGQQPVLDPNLYFVRGFDPATNTFKYDVNPRFGNSRLQTTARNAPFRLTLDVVYDVGPERERQQLGLTLRTGRKGDITQQKMNEQQLFGRYQNSIPNPFDQILRQMDTLQLTTEQADSLASLNRSYSRFRDETWRPIAKYLAALPDDYDLGEAWDKVKTAQNAVLEKMVVLGPAARTILTKEQMNKLPPIITIFLDENSIRAYKPGNSNGRGRFGGG
jgi:hypothetical protein